MNKLEWKKFYGGTRRECKALVDWGKYPDVLTVMVPFFMPLEASSIDRHAIIQAGDMEIIDVVLDENGVTIHEKWGEGWRHNYVTARREK